MHIAGNPGQSMRELRRVHHPASILINVSRGIEGIVIGVEHDIVVAMRFELAVNHIGLHLHVRLGGITCVHTPRAPPHKGCACDSVIFCMGWYYSMTRDSLECRGNHHDKQHKDEQHSSSSVLRSLHRYFLP